MKTQIHSLLRLVCAASATLLIIGSSAQAGYIVTLKQAGSNVVATGSGAIDVTGLPFFFPDGGHSRPGMTPAISGLATGNEADFDLYGGALSGPTNFGSGSSTFASAGSGDLVGLDLADPSLADLFLPVGYVSGTALSDSATYNGATFTSLGVTPGTYKWTWGTGANQNFTLKIVTATVPESGSTFSLLFLSLIPLLAISRRSLRLS